MRVWFALMSMAVILSGCPMMGTSNRTYTSPEKLAQFKNEIFIEKPFEETWDALVRDLAKSFYVINNIDKQSRIINVSFATDTPEKYVDCGTSTRTYTRGDDNHTYTYNVAASSTFKVALRTEGRDPLPLTHDISRRTSLDGRANIYVAPEGQHTRMSVNARYVLSVTVQGVYVVESFLGTPGQRGTVPQSTTTATFTTNEPTTVNWGTSGNPGPVTCQSRGQLEREILALVQQ